jgi:hypothetical protein
MVAAWRFVRCDDSVRFVVAVASVSSVVWFSSTFEDEAGFLPRVDWRVGAVDTTGAFALPRGDYFNREWKFK